MQTGCSVYKPKDSSLRQSHISELFPKNSQQVMSHIKSKNVKYHKRREKWYLSIAFFLKKQSPQNMETLVVGVVEDNTVFRWTVSERWLTFSTTAMEVRSNILKVERNGLYVCVADKIFSQMQTKQKFYKKNRDRGTLKASRFTLR